MSIDDLNDEQKAIVIYEGDKFLSVQAGPGSGKTRVIVEKVKYMINKLNVKPESFLIVTFSIDAAQELQDRLIEGNIPASDVQKMQISTIHSFCLKILEETGNVGLDVVAEGDKLYLFIKKHLEDLGFKDECTVSNYEIYKIIEKYNEYSTFQVNTKKLAKYITNNFPVDDDYIEYVHEQMEKNGEFPSDGLKEKDEEDESNRFTGSYKNAKFLNIAESYETYLELLNKENAIDYPQMQIKALEKMNEGYMPLFTNILIDEFQDTDPVQYEIFKKFIENDNTDSFTVVGDINQSIYGFRGSNKNYFKQLKEDFPEKFIEKYMYTNYRSTYEIIDSSQDFISEHYKNDNDVPEAICGREEDSKREAHNNTYFMVSEDKKKEAENLFKVIKHLLKDETIKCSDIGVLMRSIGSSCFNELKKLLDENDIRYQVKGIGDLKESEELKYILTLMYHLIQDKDPYYTFVPPQSKEWLNLKTLTGENDNKVLFELSEETKTVLNEVWEDFENEVKKADKQVCSNHEGWGTGIRKYAGIFSYDKKDERRYEVFSRVKKPILSDENLREYGVTNQRDLDFFKELNKLKNEVNEELYYDRPTITDVYFRLLTDITGYLTEEVVNTEEVIVNNLAMITSSLVNYEEVISERGLRGAFWFIMKVISNYDAYKPDEDAIQFMTVHGSKGLEFPVTILASVRKHGFPLDYRDPNVEPGYITGKPTYHTPDEYLGFKKYEHDDAEEAHVQEEERIIYVAKTRAEDELILSIIAQKTEEEVNKAIEKSALENIKAISKGPKRIQSVIDDNLDYYKLINPEDVDINILKPKEKSPKEDIVNLSFTALQNFHECPMKFKLANMFNFKVSQKKEIDAGIFIHRALEIINKKILANKNEYIGDDEVKETVETLFEKANVMLKEEKPEMYNDHLTSITADVLEYYNTVGNNLTMLESEYGFYLKEKDYAFTGKIDLIYEKDGQLGIIDYKNTSLVGKEYLEKYRKQLHLYVMALRDENHEYHGKQIEKLNIYAIKYKGDQFEDKLIPFEVDESYIEELKQELQDTALQIKDGEFKASCEDCSNCPYRKICKK